MVEEAYMKKEYYVETINMQDVIRIEDKLYGLYVDIVLNFKESFSLYNCEIETIRCWTTDSLESATNFRPILECEYVCWICYEVLYNGKPIVYDNENSQLTRSFCVLTISKKMKHHKQKFLVRIFDDTTDVVEELAEDLSKIKQMRNQSDK